MDTKEQAELLIASGYCCTSNRYCLLSRLDRPDWLEYMGRDHTDGFPGDPQENFEQGMRWARGLGDGAADFYRRVHSRDKITVSREVFEAVKRIGPGSHGWGHINDYREVVIDGVPLAG